jgi:hypothetical protein
MFLLSEERIDMKEDITWIFIYYFLLHYGEILILQIYIFQDLLNFDLSGRELGPDFLNKNKNIYLFYTLSTRSWLSWSFST